MDGWFLFSCRFWLLVGANGLGFHINSSTCMYLISLHCPYLVVRVGFLVLCGWRRVGSIPERLGLMVFSLMLAWKRDVCFSLP